MSYPSNQRMLSTTEYKVLTGTTTTDYDAFLDVQIPATERAIEQYCRRRFLNYKWAEWFAVDRQVITSNWPITQVYLVGLPSVAFSIADSNNNSYSLTQETPTNITITPKLSVVNTDTLTASDYNLSNYTSIGSLVSAIEANVTGITVTYGTTPTTVDYTKVNTATLRSSSGKTFYAGINYFNQSSSSFLGDIWRLSDNSDRIFLNPNLINTSRLFANGYDYYSTGWGNVDPNNNVTLDYYSPDDMLIVYQAGYASTDVPVDLKQTIANIVRDIVSVYDMDNSGIPKNIFTSETLGDYTYSLNPDSTLGNLISVKYKDALDFYKKKII